MRYLILCKKFGKIILFCCHESSKRRFANRLESNGLYPFLQIRGIVEPGLGHLFIISSTSHLLYYLLFALLTLYYLLTPSVHPYTLP